MNFYTLALAVKGFIDDCQKIAMEQFNTHFNALDPLSSLINEDASVFRPVDYTYMPSTNYRIDIFESEGGIIRYALYSPKASAFNHDVMNSHSALSSLLDRTTLDGIDYSRRWCGFYTRVTGNGDEDILILYGMSSDYPHNEYADEVVKEFCKRILTSKNPFMPEKVVVIYKNSSTVYTQESFKEEDIELPF